MKKKFLFVLALLPIVLVLSSCTVNVFKSFNVPSSLVRASQNALDAANNGDARSAVSLSNEVIATVAGSEVSNEGELYKALTSSSTQSREIIDETAMNVEKIKDKIVNEEISPQSTTGIVVRNAAIAMIRGVSKAKNIGLTQALSEIVNLVSQNEAEPKASSNGTDVNETQLSKAMLIVFSLDRDMSTMNLMGALSGLLSLYGGDDAFNWGVAATLYDALYDATAFFDSNRDGVLNTSDRVFKYVWDFQKNEFKELNEINIQDLMNVSLSTYQDVELSKAVLTKLHDAVTNATIALNHLPQSLNSYESTIREALKMAKEAEGELTPDKLASFENLRALVVYLVKVYEGA